ncbi:CGNR zinc finger protein [Actinocorallia herbida]|uniref:CGNR zinc finger protein n=2 Tax=Actinocorallia herbida TaxID=58109 RepID=A0A3N1CTW0_9ACTN|nr:CGNR zinc finger protein [Actinocorallia herbida]
MLAADLVNLTGEFTAADLEPLLASHGIVETRLSAEEVADLADWADRLTPVFGAQDLDERCAKINALLARTVTRPYISMHDHHPHLHYSVPGAGAVARIRAVTIAGLAYVVCFASASRLGRCARGRCTTAFVDTSRNGRRAYCSVRCANNDAVARHRSRS